MNPINYGEIIEKAEARRAALEELTALLPSIPAHWSALCDAAAALSAIDNKYRALDTEAKLLLAKALGMSEGVMDSGLYYLARSKNSSGSSAQALIQALMPEEPT